MTMKIMHDLDGCVADFVSALAIRIREVANTEDIDKIPSKSLRRGIRKYLRSFPKDHLCSKEDLHHKDVKDLLYKLAAEEGFFYTLPLIDNGLWSFISQYDNIEFLSAPIGQYAKDDKTRWVRDVLGATQPVHVVERKHKIDFVGENNILIDDLPKTINEWNSKGGHGFLWTGVEGGDVKALREFLDGLGVSPRS